MNTHPLATVAAQQQFCKQVSDKYVSINYSDALAALDYILYGTYPPVHHKLCDVVLREYRNMMVSQPTKSYSNS